MSAPSIQPDLSGPSLSTERQALDAAIALAPTISIERVLEEVAQQLRRFTGCDAVAIALLGEDEELRPVHVDGFGDAPEALLASLTDAWRRAIDEEVAVTRAARSGDDITVPMIGADVRGVITIRVTGLDSTPRREELEHVAATVASQAAPAIQRALIVDRLAQKRRLEAIGEVSAGIAHELRNPLFGISSAAQLLRFRVRDDPVIEKNVGRILREVERLNGVVSSLLEYARPAPLRRSLGDPDAVWHAVLAAKRGLLESKALVIRHHSAAPGSICDMDAEQIGQVFVSLLTNAADAAPEGSDLLLSSTSLANGAWRCRLHNEGAAIAPEVLPRVFDLFFSTKPGAAGVGLPLCQRILAEHGGTIALESAADTGTTVTISLPGRRSDDASINEPRHG
jgi:signal transduction histidine kinase